MKMYGPLIAFSVLLHLSGYYALLHRIEPFQYYFYLTAWWSYIIFIDTIIALREKRFLILNRRLPLLIIISCAFWCIFEMMNIRIENWFYINLPGGLLHRYGGYLLAYGTVVPAIYGTGRLISLFLGNMRVRPLHIRNYPYYAISVGIASFAATLIFPSYCFPLAWGFLAFLLDGYTYMKGYPSFMGDLEKGEAGSLLSSLLSGLVCGLLWETWNFWNIAKWVYTVPFFDELKVFEMPIPGYIGFLAFGLETMTLVNLLGGIGIYRKYTYRAVVGALLFSLLAFTMIDRFTVFSYAPPVSGLTFLKPDNLKYFEDKGLETSYAIDPNLLDKKEKASLALVQLKGLGIDHFDRLSQQGVSTVRGLSRLDEQTFSRITGETNMRRVMVYLKAAKAYCRQMPDC
jgi:hypothetical protein